MAKQKCHDRPDESPSVATHDRLEAAAVRLARSYRKKSVTWLAVHLAAQHVRSRLWKAEATRLQKVQADLERNHALFATTTALIEAIDNQIVQAHDDLIDRDMERSRKGGVARQAADPKQHAKKAVKKLWERWIEKPSLYPSKAAFARSMLREFAVLESHKSIEDWTTTWSREKGVKFDRSTKRWNSLTRSAERAEH